MPDRRPDNIAAVPRRVGAILIIGIGLKIHQIAILVESGLTLPIASVTAQ